MKYFFLTADAENPLPYPEYMHQQIDTRYLNKQDAHKIERFHAFYVRANDETLFADVLTNPMFMVSKGVAEVMNYYDSSMDYKIAAIYSPVNNIAKTYYLPILDRIDCLTDHTEFTSGGGEILQAEINVDKTMGKAIFRLAGIKKHYIVVRLDFVESLLRRRALGLKLTEIFVRKTVEEIPIR